MEKNRIDKYIHEDPAKYKLTQATSSHFYIPAIVFPIPPLLALFYILANFQSFSFLPILFLMIVAFSASFFISQKLRKQLQHKNLTLPISKKIIKISSELNRSLNLKAGPL